VKHLKSFEKLVNSEFIKALDDFYKEYEYYNKQPYSYDAKKSGTFYHYDLPDFILDEFNLLHFLYQNRNRWKSGNEHCDEFVKKEIKKVALKSLIKKIDEDANNYSSLKNALDKRTKFNNYNSLEYIHNAATKYIFFLLISAINKSPLSKNLARYNL
jgi:hypothetical protein